MTKGFTHMTVLSCFHHMDYFHILITVLSLKHTESSQGSGRIMLQNETGPHLSHNRWRADLSRMHSSVDAALLCFLSTTDAIRHV